MDDLSFSFNQSDVNQIKTHLHDVNTSFDPKLESYVDIELYADKLYKLANRFEVFSDKTLVALLAIYINKDGRYAFITNLSVSEQYARRGIATTLLRQAIDYAKHNELNKILLEVKVENKRAINFYLKHNFSIIKEYDKLTLEYIIK
ncbi:MAG: GNAT family N-acetyltransferase [Bacteroidales bacterium]|nr:GNAT family N-acetyltransferase [Bacteroidales bacterium]